MSTTGPNVSLRLKRPYRSNDVTHAPNAPGTVAGKKPSPGMRSRFCARNQSMVAHLGAIPCPVDGNNLGPVSAGAVNEDGTLTADAVGLRLEHS